MSERLDPHTRCTRCGHEVDDHALATGEDGVVTAGSWQEGEFVICSMALLAAERPTWTPCRVEMPPPRVPVLGWIGSVLQLCDLVAWSGSVYHSSSGGMWTRGDVTHWLPLPPGPPALLKGAE